MTNPDDLEFVLIFQDPDDQEVEYISGSILAGCSAADFEEAITEAY